MFARLLSAAALLCVLGSTVALDWEDVTKVLTDAIEDNSFPGCVAVVANKSGVVYEAALGNFTYGLAPPHNKGANPPVSRDTIWDMASCTKVTTTTTAVAQLYEMGLLPLETPIGDLFPEFKVHNKEGVTVRNCLLHNAGFPPDPNPFWNKPEFACPETKKFHPAENFSCMQKIWDNWAATKLDAPVGAQYVYSDLSFITLMFVVGHVVQKHNLVDPSQLLPSCATASSQPVAAQCHFEAYVRTHVFDKLGMSDSGFLPVADRAGRCAPTVNDTSYMHTTIQGVVEDPNTYAMGGISGHAGLFATAPDLLRLGSALMWPNDVPVPVLNATTIALFTREANHTQSSRALGWNTNDHTVPDYGFNSSCGSLSKKTWMHDGYTGTMICGDPDREIVVMLLTNRVYPTETNIKIRQVRTAFSNMVQQVYDQQLQ